MVVQLVEGVKELLLRPLLGPQDLDIVDEEHIGFPVPLVKLRHAIRTNAGDHLVHEALARSVDHPHGAEFVGQLAPDGVHQVGLAHADSAIEE